MTNGLFTLLLAGALTVPHITLANEGTVGLGTAGGARAVQPHTQSWETGPLHAIPHLDAIPWATSEFALRGPKIDILLGPKPDMLGPFLVQPSTPPQQFFTNTAPRDN